MKWEVSQSLVFFGLSADVAIGQLFKPHVAPAARSVRLTWRRPPPAVRRSEAPLRVLRLYHSSVHPLAEQFLDHIRRHDLLQPGDRVGVAVSGGADSTALLRLLLELRKELGVVLSVAHLNHKLRGPESDNDLEFVAKLAGEHKLAFHSTTVDVAQHAATARMSMEAAARQVRYEYFSRLLRDKTLDRIATGHTLDDQAETVLLRLIRGTGMRGLRGIQPRIDLGPGQEVVRPLLWIARRELLNYLKSIGQAWREDSTNRETRYTRNRVRQVLLPLLEREFNPAVTQNLAELADIARAEEDYWESEVEGWMGTVVQWAPATSSSQNYVSLNQLISPGSSSSRPVEDTRMNAIVDLHWLLAEPLAVQRRVIKSIGDYAEIPLEFKHVDEILQFAAMRGGGNQLSLPRGWKVLREGGTLEFKAPETGTPEAIDYEYKLPVPGEVVIKEAGVVVRTIAVDSEKLGEYAADQLFEPSRLSSKLVVRNWRPGDRFWPAHTKAPKKIKELLQEKHVSHEQRKLWPVVVSGDEIIWVRGFPGRAHFRPTDSNSAIAIAESNSPVGR